MKPSRNFSFLRPAGISGTRALWRALAACFLFFSLVGVQTVRAQIFQFAKDDANYAAALSVAFAQEAKDAVNLDQKISLDEDFTPADFGVETVGTLPNSPFYFLKTARRGIASFFTFDPTKKAELSLQYASEKFVEAQTLAGEKGADPADIAAALDNFNTQLERAQGRIERAGTTGTDAAKDTLSEKVMDSVLKYTKSLDRLEKDLPPEAAQKIEETKDTAFATFGTVGGLLAPEKVAEKVAIVLDDQKGSEFKNFKNVEVLKEVQENAAPALGEALKVAEDNTLIKLQNELEGLENSKKALLKDFVQEVSGNELRHLEIIGELEARPVSVDLRDAISNAKEETLVRTEKRLETLTPEQRKEYWQHLESGDLEDVRIVKELENNIKPEVFQNVAEIKKSVTESYAKKFENTSDKEKEKILEKVGQFHDAESLAIFDEINALIPDDKKGVFEEIKKRAAEAIRKDLDGARNVEQRKVILDSLAGDHPEELQAIEWFKNGADKSYKNVFDALAQTQFKAIEDHAGQINDKDRLANFESDVRKQQDVFKESPFDFKRIFGFLEEKKKVFESGNVALEKVRAAEVVVSDFRDVANTLPLDAAFSDGKFDYAAQEIGRLLALAERRVEMARTVLGYNDVGRAFNEAEQAEKIARDGLRMAQDYKAGRKKVVPPPPFFLPTTPQEQTGTGAGGTGGMQLYNEYEFGQYCFYVGGFMKARSYCALDDGRIFDGRGKRFPLEVPPEFVPRLDTTTTEPREGGKCPAIFSPGPDFCTKGKIVYKTDDRGCGMPPVCESGGDTSVRTNPSDPSLCGGIAGFQCSRGYVCQMSQDLHITDAMGKCVVENPYTCQAYFTGYIFDNATQICRKDSASGCRNPFVYQTMEACTAGHTGSPSSSFPYKFAIDGYVAQTHDDAGNHCYVLLEAGKISAEFCKQFGVYWKTTPPASACPQGSHMDMNGSGISYCLNNANDVLGLCYEIPSMMRISCPESGIGGKGDDPGVECPAGQWFNPTQQMCVKAPSPVSVPIVGKCPMMPTVATCPTGQKRVVSYSTAECGTYYSCEIAGTDTTKWVKHFWKFNDGFTTESMILNRTDAEYTSYISSVEAQCVTIPMKRFTWRPSAGNDSVDNWKNFGIPDCSGTATLVCGDNMCSSGETVSSCPQDCGGTTGGGGTTSTMKRCFYPNASQSGTTLGYSVWCEADYYNCHKETPTGTELKIEGLSLGAPSSCEGAAPSGGTCSYYTQTACNGDQMCVWGNNGCGQKSPCNDGKDNDSDGLIDYPADTGCSSSLDWTETPDGGTGYVDCTVYKSSTSCMGPSCRWDSASTSCLAVSGTTSGGGCRTQTTETYCKAAYCTWYANHYDGTHCDDAAHGGTTTTTTTSGDPSLSIPTGLTATKISGGVKLEWNSSAQNAMKVKIYRQTNGAWAFRDEYSITSGTSGMMSYMDTTATAGSYTYKVQVCHASGCSGDSSTTSITVTSTTTGTTQCSDGKDNDGDGWIDMGDSGCYGPDDNDETYVAPTVTPTGTSCSSTNSAACTTSTSCAGVGSYWCTPSGYPPGCSSSPCPSSGGGTSTSCPTGQYWYVPSGGSSTSGYCMSSSTPPPSGSGTCSSMPGYCTTEASCTSYNFYWCNGGCVSNSSMCSGGVSSCSSSTVPGNCTSSTACGGAGYYWCSTNNTCLPSSSGCTSSNTSTTCPTGQYWYMPSGGGTGYCMSTTSTPPPSSSSCPSGWYWTGSMCAANTSSPPPSSSSYCNSNGTCETSIGEGPGSCPADCH